MRIRYSIVIPIIFVLFCAIFTYILYMALKEEKDQEEASQQDQQVIYFLNEDIKGLKMSLGGMQTALNDNSLEAAMELYQKARGHTDNMKGYIDSISDKNREYISKQILHFGKQLDAVQAALFKGDVKTTQQNIDKLLKELQ